MDSVIAFLFLTPIVVVAWAFAIFFVVNIAQSIRDIYKRGW